ncbi:uncharacterized protein K452DRAFT_360834 [Aplosporella prunicola CBS 121167]|uniref:CID domain-containing protein n=1 Tax=Aplosporella prunicola CBS 121167 TaxID=1176127 RepID=A0A6A6B7A0_9PEZI|nr:uncharacterized protein K452DRAFT_360834 [Aplosporella prunicola CBS 121167]KAF2139115.1 hypothetical protein K452DRAFT_360834 [Aplosporella prunicola CBS 121167]
MAYTDDAVKAKLSALNETQEGIVTVAQWIMFHRRHAERTSQLWLQRLKDSTPNKRLSLIYLANEVVQQSKARRKTEFVVAYSTIIVEATSLAYKGATHDVQQKIRRVIEVWRQRGIFEVPIQDQVEKSLDELDKNGSAGKKPRLGGSLFSSGPATPLELQPLVPLATALSKADSTTKPTMASAYAEYDKLIDPGMPTPTPPVHAARLSAVLKSLASAEGAVAESIKARKELIQGLEKMLDANKVALANDQNAHTELDTRRQGIEAKKREVEDNIMRGLSAEPPPAGAQPNPPATNDPRLSADPRRAGRTMSADGEPAAPDVEALTPPPVESLTPVGSPRPVAATTTTGADTMTEQPPSHTEPLPANVFDLARMVPQARSHENDDISGAFEGQQHGQGAAKRRKVDGEFTDFTDGDQFEGIDADVAAMLGRE